METTLMIVTIIALALALGMSGLAWRLLRDNRHRTAARVQALQQLAEEETPLADEEEWDAPVAGSEVPRFRRSEVRVPRWHRKQNRGTAEPRNLGTVSDARDPCVVIYPHLPSPRPSIQ